MAYLKATTLVFTAAGGSHSGVGSFEMGTLSQRRSRGRSPSEGTGPGHRAHR